MHLCAGTPSLTMFFLCLEKELLSLLPGTYKLSAFAIAISLSFLILSICATYSKYSGLFSKSSTLMSLSRLLFSFSTFILPKYFSISYISFSTFSFGQPPMLTYNLLLALDLIVRVILCICYLGNVLA